jgi:hypothetical protein
LKNRFFLLTKKRSKLLLQDKEWQKREREREREREKRGEKFIASDARRETGNSYHTQEGGLARSIRACDYQS